MILKYFKNKENTIPDIYNYLYIDIINSTKLITFKILKIKKVDFVTTFEVITIILFCIFYGYKKNTSSNYIFKKQELMNLFISDIDHSLRLQGLDMTLGKYVKIYLKKFYFRLKELEKVFIIKNKLAFEAYLTNYNLYNKFTDHSSIVNLYEDLIILIKRCENQVNTTVLFDDLFN